MYQLAARMSAAVPASPFQTILQEVKKKKKREREITCSVCCLSLSEVTCVLMAVATHFYPSTFPPSWFVASPSTTLITVSTWSWLLLTPVKMTPSRLSTRPVPRRRRAPTRNWARQNPHNTLLSMRLVEWGGGREDDACSNVFRIRSKRQKEWLQQFIPRSLRWCNPFSCCVMPT